MNLPFQPQAFYTALAAMRQFRTAGRLLEACLEDDGESHLEMERPTGQVVELGVSTTVGVSGASMLHTIAPLSTATLQTAESVPGREPVVT